MGIALLFVLTSCPIKASIKQNLSLDVKTENKNSNSVKADSWIEYNSLDCNLASEQIKTQNFGLKESKIQPVIFSLFSLSLILFSIRPRNDLEDNHGIVPKINSNQLFLKFSRLNL